jgi:hypothetical protein
MTEAKKYWIADAGRREGVVTGATAHNLWTAGRGWAESTEPSGLDWVWLQHDEHRGRRQVQRRGRAAVGGPRLVPVGSAGAGEPGDRSLGPQRPRLPRRRRPPQPRKPAANATSGDKKE